MKETTLKPGWKTFRFDEIAISVTDRVQPAETELEHYVGLEHLDPESLKIRRWGSPSDVIGQKLGFRKGDIIFGKRRAYQRKLAVADFDGICSAHAMVLRPETDVVLPEFLPFFMQSDLFMNRAMEISVGSLSPTINWRTLAQQEFPLPSLDEQRRIAKLFLSLEDTFNSTYELVNSTSKLRESFAFSIWLENSAEMNMAKLGTICEKIQDGTHFSPKSTTGKFRYVTSKNIKNGYLDISDCGWISKEEHEQIYRRCDVQQGDILLTKDGANTGNVAINHLDEPFSLLSSVALIRTNENILLSKYLFEYLRSLVGRRNITSMMKGTAITRITLKQINAVKIPLPEIHTQIEITRKFQQLNSAFASAEFRHSSVKIMKNSLLKELNGENDVQ